MQQSVAAVAAAVSPSSSSPVSASQASSLFSSVDPSAVSSPALSPRRRASSVLIRDTQTDDSAPSSSPSPVARVAAADAAASSSSPSLAPVLEAVSVSAASPAPSHDASLAVSQSSPQLSVSSSSSPQSSVPSTPLATLSYTQSDALPALVTASHFVTTATSTQTVASTPPTTAAASTFAAPHLSLHPPAAPPSHPSCPPVRLLFPLQTPRPLSSLPLSSPDTVSYHQQRLLSPQRHSVRQGELLLLYLLVPYAQRRTFPWLFPPDSPALPSVRVGQAVVVMGDVQHCPYRVEVRLRAASVKGATGSAAAGQGGEDGDDAKEADDLVSSPVSVSSAPPAPLPHPPASLHLSSSFSSAAEPPAAAPAAWSRFTNRFQRKSAVTAAAAVQQEKETPSVSPVSASASSPPSQPAASTSMTSPVSAPPVLDTSTVARTEAPRRVRSLGSAGSPSHVPPHIVLSSQSAFQHDPPSHLPHRASALLSSPTFVHASSPPQSFLLRLSNGDVAIAVETVMLSSSLGLLWLELELSPPSPHPALLSVLAPIPGTSLLHLPSPSVVRDFIADHRVLRLPPPHAVAGAALVVEDGLQVESRSEIVNDRLLFSVTVRVAGAEDVELEDCELLLHSTRWLLDEGKGRKLRKGEVSVPVPLSSLMLLSSHPVSFPVSLSSSASSCYHFLFYLDPVSSFSSLLSTLRSSLTSSLLHHPALGAAWGEGVSGSFLTSAVISWRGRHMSTAISSEHAVQWRLPLPLTLEAGGGGLGEGLVPGLTLRYPPTVSLHSIFTVSATVHNAWSVPLTFTLHVMRQKRRGGIEGGAEEASSLRSSVAASSMSSPRQLLLQVAAQSSASSAPFSPVDGYHFPFQSFAARLSKGIAAQQRQQQQAEHRQQQHRDSGTHETKTAEREEDGDAEDESDSGVLCLERRVELGVLAGGAVQTVPLQWLALRCGFTPLHRLAVHVAESDAVYCSDSSGDVFVSSSSE